MSGNLTIIYNEAGRPCNDFAVEEGAHGLVVLAGLYGNYTSVTSSMLLVTRLRVARKEGELAGLTVQHLGNKYPVNADGTMSNWGDIPDFYLDYIGRIVG